LTDMKALHTTCIIIATVINLTGCEYFSSSKELAARKISQNPQDQITSMSEVATNKAAINIDDPLCKKLLTLLPNEPYFYQFQANLRAYKENDLAGQLVQSHMSYRNLLDPKSKTEDESSYLRYDTCAESILSVDRYQDVLALKKQMNEPIPVELPAH